MDYENYELLLNKLMNNSTDFLTIVVLASFRSNVGFIGAMKHAGNIFCRSISSNPAIFTVVAEGFFVFIAEISSN